jgi:precorrin-2 methylase
MQTVREGVGRLKKRPGDMALITRHGTRYTRQPIVDFRPARKVVSSVARQIATDYYEHNIEILPKHRTVAWARDQILEEGFVAVSRRIHGARRNPYKLMGEIYVFGQYFEKR